MDDGSSQHDTERSQEQLLAVGTHIEVRSAFDGTWSRGFTIVDTSTLGYRIRRRSDDVEVPTLFSPADVRRERKRSTWWV